MVTVISCRQSVYGSMVEAFQLLPEAGIRHVEVGVPEDLDFQITRRLAQEHGVSIATVATGLDLDSMEDLEAFRPVMRAVAGIGTKKIFVSVKGSDHVARPELIRRLRVAAEEAKELGLILCMETHPPFGTNGDEARRTIEEVASEGLRFNFDTANVYYYNPGTDAVSELMKVVPYVASVHLKDTDGGYHSPQFPVLGQGVVPYPRVFEILGERGFEGPYTLELEGPLTDGKSTPEIHRAVLACMAYLRSIGVAGA